MFTNLFDMSTKWSEVLAIIALLHWDRCLECFNKGALPSLIRSPTRLPDLCRGVPFAPTLLFCHDSLMLQCKDHFACSRDPELSSLVACGHPKCLQAAAPSQWKAKQISIQVYQMDQYVGRMISDLQENMYATPNNMQLSGMIKAIAQSGQYRPQPSFHNGLGICSAPVYCKAFGYYVNYGVPKPESQPHFPDMVKDSDFALFVGQWRNSVILIYIRRFELSRRRL